MSKVQKVLALIRLRGLKFASIILFPNLVVSNLLNNKEIVREKIEGWFNYCSVLNIWQQKCLNCEREIDKNA